MRQRQKRGGLFSLALRSLVLLSLCNCVALPRPPQTALCSYDNSSKDDNSDKSPNFKCFGANDIRFKMRWNSESADKMICTPYKDYIELNAYYKKVFELLEREIMNKRRGK